MDLAILGAKALPSSSPWLRRYVIGCVVIPAAILVLTGIGLVVWMQWSFRNARADLEREIALVRQSGEPLSGLELEARYNTSDPTDDFAEKLLQSLEFDPKKFQLSKLPVVGIGPEPPPPGQEWPELPEVEAFLDEQAYAFEQLELLRKREKPLRFPVEFALGVRATFFHLEKLLLASRLLRLRLHVALHSNKPEEAFEIIEANFSLSECLKDEPALVSQLVRCVLVTSTIKAIELSLQIAVFQDWQLTHFHEKLQGISMHQAAKNALIGERSISYSTLSLPDEFLKPGGQPLPSREQLVLLEGRFPDRHLDSFLFLKLVRRQIAAVDESWPEALREAECQQQELKQLAKSPTRYLYIYTMLLYPAVPTALNAFALTEAALKACDSAIAAVRFRRAKGDWPAQLDDLAPEFLPATPSDPYNSLPLRFVRTAEELKFYSVGQDLVDDGGTWEASDGKPDVGVKIPITAQ